MAGKSGVGTTSIMPADRQPLKYAAEAREFTATSTTLGAREGAEEGIKKGLKVMCRETRMRLRRRSWRSRMPVLLSRLRWTRDVGRRVGQRLHALRAARIIRSA